MDNQKVMLDENLNQFDKDYLESKMRELEAQLKKTRTMKQFYEWDADRSKEVLPKSEIKVSNVINRMASMYEVDLSDKKELILEGQFKEALIPTNMQSISRMFAGENGTYFQAQSNGNAKDNYFKAKEKIEEVRKAFAEKGTAWDPTNPNAFTAIGKWQSLYEAFPDVPRMKEILDICNDERYRVMYTLETLYNKGEKEKEAGTEADKETKYLDFQTVINKPDIYSDWLKKNKSAIDLMNRERLLFNRHLDEIRISHGDRMRLREIPLTKTEYESRMNELKDDAVAMQEFRIDMETFLYEYNSNLPEGKEPYIVQDFAELYFDETDTKDIKNADLRSFAVEENEILDEKVEFAAISTPDPAYSKIRTDIDDIVKLGKDDKDLSYEQNVQILNRILRSVSDPDITVGSIDEYQMLDEVTDKEELKKNRDAINRHLDAWKKQYEAEKKDAEEIAKRSTKIPESFKEIENARREAEEEKDPNRKIVLKKAVEKSIRHWNNLANQQIDRYVHEFLSYEKDKKLLTKEQQQEFDRIKAGIPEKYKLSLNGISRNDTTEKDPKKIRENFEKGYQTSYKNLDALLKFTGIDDLMSKDRGSDNTPGYEKSTEQIKKDLKSKNENVIKAEQVKVEKTFSAHVKNGEFIIPVNQEEFRNMSVYYQLRAQTLINEEIAKQNSNLAPMQLNRIGNEQKWEDYQSLIEQRNREILDIQNLENSGGQKSFQFKETFKELLELNKDSDEYKLQIKNYVALMNEMIKEGSENVKAKSFEVHKGKIVEVDKYGNPSASLLARKHEKTKHIDFVNPKYIGQTDASKTHSEITESDFIAFISDMQKENRDRLYKKAGTKDKERIGELDRKYEIMLALKGRAQELNEKIAHRTKTETQHILSNGESTVQEILDNYQKCFGEGFPKSKEIKELEEVRKKQAEWETHEIVKAAVKNMAKDYNPGMLESISESLHRDNRSKAFAAQKTSFSEDKVKAVNAEKEAALVAEKQKKETELKKKAETLNTEISLGVKGYLIYENVLGILKQTSGVLSLVRLQNEVTQKQEELDALTGKKTAIKDIHERQIITGQEQGDSIATYQSSLMNKEKIEKAREELEERKKVLEQAREQVAYSLDLFDKLQKQKNEMFEENLRIAEEFNNSPEEISYLSEEQKEQILSKMLSNAKDKANETERQKAEQMLTLAMRRKRVNNLSESMQFLGNSDVTKTIGLMVKGAAAIIQTVTGAEIDTDELFENINSTLAGLAPEETKTEDAAAAKKAAEISAENSGEMNEVDKIIHNLNLAVIGIVDQVSGYGSQITEKLDELKSELGITEAELKQIQQINKRSELAADKDKISDEIHDQIKEFYEKQIQQVLKEKEKILQEETDPKKREELSREKEQRIDYFNHQKQKLNELTGNLKTTENAYVTEVVVNSLKQSMTEVGNVQLRINQDNTIIQNETEREETLQKKMDALKEVDKKYQLEQLRLQEAMEEMKKNLEEQTKQFNEAEKEYNSKFFKSKDMKNKLIGIQETITQMQGTYEVLGHEMELLEKRKKQEVDKTLEESKETAEKKQEEKLIKEGSEEVKKGAEEAKEGSKEVKEGAENAKESSEEVKEEAKEKQKASEEKTDSLEDKFSKIAKSSLEKMDAYKEELENQSESKKAETLEADAKQRLENLKDSSKIRVTFDELNMEEKQTKTRPVRERDKSQEKTKQPEKSKSEVTKSQDKVK